VPEEPATCGVSSARGPIRARVPGKAVA